MSQIFSNVIPILTLILIGYIIRYKAIMTEKTMEELKRIVLNLSLPSVLFVTFVNMKLRREYLVAIAITFFMLILFQVLGVLANKIKKLNNDLNPFIVSANAFGLMGIPLYGTVFGIENLEKITILGVAHELFIWSIYFSALRMKFNSEKFSFATLKGIIKSPIILSILLGLAINLLDLFQLIKSTPLLNGFYTTIIYLSNIATPLILMVIGFDLKLEQKYMKESTKLIAFRLFITLIVGYIIKFTLLDQFIYNDKLFDYAYFTFLVLPLPFVLPIFMDQYSTKEKTELINNSVVLSILVCMALFIGFSIFISV